MAEKLFLNTTGEKMVDALEGIKRVLEGGIANPIFGVRRSLATSATSWIRTDESKGLVANATKDGSEVQNDFDYIYPWSDIKTVNILNDKVVAEIGDSNFTFDGSNGDVMTYVPSFYIKRWQDTEYEHIQIARNYFDGAVKIEPFYIGRYTMSEDIKSKNGVLSKVNQNISWFRNQAKTKGSSWCQLDWHYFILQDLFLVEFANAESQSVLGQGICSDGAQHVLGECDSLDMKSGCLANDGKHSVIYRGVENPFGNIWQFVDGINIKDYVAYVCYDNAQYVSDKFTEPYEMVGYVNANANGNPRKMGYDAKNQLIALPVEVGTSTYGDYYWQNAGNIIVFVGGYWNRGSNDGVFYWGCNSDSGDARTYIGGRLLKTSV